MSKRLNLPSALGILLIGIFSANVSHAQTATGATWDNTGLEWTSGTSWVGDNAPTNDNALVGNIATFSNAAAGFNTVNLSSGRGIYGLVFVSGANAYTFTGSALTVGSGGGISNNSASLQTFNNRVINNGANPLYGSYAGGSLIFAGGIDITTPTSTASRTLTLGGSGDITVSGSIASGAAVTSTTGGNVSVTNTALTIFSGNNTYLGTTTVSSGARLRLGSATALGATNSGTTISSGGALDLNGQTIGAEALTISGTGVSSSGVIFNSSDSAASWSGNIAQTASSIIKATNGSITLSGGIDLAGNAASSRTLTLDGTGGIIVSGNIANSFAGSTGSIAIAANAANVTFSGNNTYNGTTIVNSGATLRIASSTGLGSTNSGTTVEVGGQLQMSGGITVDAGEALSLSGTTGATASLRNISGNNAYNGAITFNSGTNRIDSDAGTLTLSLFTNTLSGTRSLLVGGAGDTTFTGRFTGSSTALLTKDGAGTLTLANTNFDIGGGVLVNNGKLALAATNALGATRAVVINGGTLDITTFNNTVGAVSLTNGTIAGTTGVLTGTSYVVESGTISAILGGSGALTKSGSGTTTLSGNNTYTGVTTISAGTTILSGNNSAATGGLVVGGATSTADKPVLRLNSVNAISSSSSISGANSSDRTGTLDFAAGTSYTLNNYNGGNMIFTNSFGQASVVTFTNAESLLTSSAGSSGGRSLQNNSSNLKIVFDGSLDIGSSVTDTVNTIGGAGDFVVKGNIFSTTAGSVRGLSKTGTGLLEMRGDNNSYNGNTTIFNGTISVTNGAVLTGTTVRVAPTSGNSGTLLVNGTAGAVVVSARGILAGGGTVGNVTLETGSFLKPGNSPGLLTASSSTWAAGSTYNWEIDNATGTAGTNWDLFSVTGALDLAALSSGAQMNLVLESLSIANFSTSAEYSWVIAQAASFIGTGLENGTDVTSLFNINTAAFNGGAASNLPNGGFQVVTGTAGSLRTLTLMAVPEPSTGSMLGLGLAGLVVTRLLRRKNS